MRAWGCAFPCSVQGLAERAAEIPRHPIIDELHMDVGRVTFIFFALGAGVSSKYWKIQKLIFLKIFSAPNIKQYTEFIIKLQFKTVMTITKLTCTSIYPCIDS